MTVDAGDRLVLRCPGPAKTTRGLHLIATIARVNAKPDWQAGRPVFSIVHDLSLLIQNTFNGSPSAVAATQATTNESLSKLTRTRQALALIGSNAAKILVENDTAAGMKKVHSDRAKELKKGCRSRIKILERMVRKLEGTVPTAPRMKAVQRKLTEQLEARDLELIDLPDGDVVTYAPFTGDDDQEVVESEG
jgi:hypothetical protein